MTTARSFMAARAVSHSSVWLPSTTRTRSPAVTPFDRIQFAARFDRAAISAKDTSVRVPSSSTMCRAVRSLSSAMTSNQSRAQLKWGDRGQRKPAQAVA
ncbi:hypothetical protein GA0115241_108495 [Streptomyces sp. DpondAA-D4]|nr:hypothetical protein GA0115241_108495 [Streptomyces sp. DpondAA-D4]